MKHETISFDILLDFNAAQLRLKTKKVSSSLLSQLKRVLLLLIKCTILSLGQCNNRFIPHTNNFAPTIIISKFPHYMSISNN